MLKMATRDNKSIADSAEDLEKCPIKEAIDNNNERIRKMNGKPIEVPKVKKKEKTKHKKKYPLIIPLKVACVIGAILVSGSLLASIIVPDVTAVIMAILEEFDFMEQFRGGNALDPSDYVNLFKYK